MSTLLEVLSQLYCLQYSLPWQHHCTLFTILLAARAILLNLVCKTCQQGNITLQYSLLGQYYWTLFTILTARATLLYLVYNTPCKRNITVLNLVYNTHHQGKLLYLVYNTRRQSNITVLSLLRLYNYIKLVPRQELSQLLCIQLLKRLYPPLSSKNYILGRVFYSASNQ